MDNNIDIVFNNNFDQVNNLKGAKINPKKEDIIYNSSILKLLFKFVS